MALDKDDFITMLESATDAGALAIKGMTDSFPCGGAYLKADGRCELVRGFKKWGEEKGGWYYLGDWAMTNNYPSGFMFSNRKNGGYQNMGMHSAENTAYVQVFGMFNIITSVHTYID